MQIEYIDVGYVYQPKTKFAYHALRDINLVIPENKITAIIGNSGSGKSTLIQLANGIEKPTTGKIIINNGEWVLTNKRRKVKNIKILRQKIGLVFQFPEYQLFEDTVYKDIIFGLKHAGERNEKILEEKAKKYINLVGLSEDLFKRSPFELSGGQKRRVAIAGILAMEPDIVIFDEPTCGLDPEGEQEIMQILQNLNKVHKKTILFITHNMNEVYEYADQVVVMYRGSILAQDETTKIFQNVELLKFSQLTMPTILAVSRQLKDKKIPFLKLPKNITELANIIKNSLKSKRFFKRKDE